VPCVAIINKWTIRKWNLFHRDLLLNVRYEFQLKFEGSIQSDHWKIPMNLPCLKASLADGRTFTLDLGLQVQVSSTLPVSIRSPGLNVICDCLLQKSSRLAQLPEGCSERGDATAASDHKQYPRMNLWVSFWFVDTGENSGSAAREKEVAI